MSFDEDKLAIVFVRGGVVQDVQVPEGVRVEVHDYDVDSDDVDERIQTDEDGDAYWLAVWLQP